MTKRTAIKETFCCRGKGGGESGELKARRLPQGSLLVSIVKSAGSCLSILIDGGSQEELAEFLAGPVTRLFKGQTVRGEVSAMARGCRIAEMVAEEFGVTVVEMQSDRKSRRVTNPRAAALTLIRCLRFA